ncbi:MAG TPA: hypothetical protein VK631_18250, partial [Solirubrobacteraceae bacterium]|nr:hypothetical protein [Solirubrobacteraceae bacterium]
MATRDDACLAALRGASLARTTEHLTDLAISLDQEDDLWASFGPRELLALEAVSEVRGGPVLM